MNNNIPLFIFFLLVACGWQIGDATAADPTGQEDSTGLTQTMTQEDCIELGLRNNSEIKAAISQEDMAYSKLQYEKSMCFPQFSLQYDGGITNANFFLIEGTPAVMSPSQTTAGNGSSSKLFSEYKARVDLPLVGDGILCFGSHKIRRANYLLEQAGYNLDAIKRDTIAIIKEYFASAQQSQLQMEAQKESVLQYRDILHLVKEKFARNLSSQKDVLEAEYNLAKAEAELSVWQHDYERTLKQLFTVIGAPTTSRLRVESLATAIVPIPPWDHVIWKIINSNLNLKAKELEIDIAQEELSASRNKLWPTVDLVGLYSSSLADQQEFQDFYSSYVVMKIPLFELPLYRDVSTKNISVTLAKNNYHVLLKNISISAADLYKSLQDIPTQLNCYNKQIQYLNENLCENKAKYNQDLISMIDLNNALIQLNVARKEEANLYITYQRDYQKLQNLMGESSAKPARGETGGVPPD